MRLYLVRHAIAHARDRARWPQDSLRPLTLDGERRFRKAARGLAPSLAKSTLVLTSPYTRARRTAELLAAAAGLESPLDCAELSAEEPVHKIFNVLSKRADKDIVLVGHEPYLGKLLVAALAGEAARFKVEFKKGGAACVEYRGRALPGRGVLAWHLPPRMLRAMR
jgi:phosphohistidine phosphatase